MTRNTTYFNQPFSANGKSNIGKIVDELSPASNPLRKVFTRNTVKVSYKCMPNMANAVAQHNAKIMLGVQALTDGEGLQRKCKTDCVIHKASKTKVVKWKHTVE